MWMDAYLCIEQYICFALDASHIIHLYLILLQIFSKYHTKFWTFFSPFFISPYLFSSPTKIDRKTGKTDWLAGFGFFHILKFLFKTNENGLAYR
jgi:hypothetical protein